MFAISGMLNRWVLNTVLAQYNIVLARYIKKVSLERKIFKIFEQTGFLTLTMKDFRVLSLFTNCSNF